MARQRPENFEREWRISEEAANGSKETREFQNKEQTARKRLETFVQAREFEIKEQTAPKERKFQKSKAFERDWRIRISKEIREHENKEQTTRKELENYRARGKPSERD